MEPITPDAATEVHASRERARASAAQFAPGSMVAERYRIVSLLGSGGMGEVYRADDVKLGQRVALKHVSEAIPIEQLYKEVRIGREISHPNVCRLHDVVEVDGQRFIAMEYVDGEDLASLLRRIGRLPQDKAIALAHDLCAGLAAAHDRGFIHRDLKPANVMIDGRGNARITDFGLAALAADVAHDFGGTPLYMAPEQLEQGLATVRSDIYSLGLVLFEMFTGRRVFNARTSPELRSQHSLEKTRPSSVVRDIDPVVERVILRCIDENAAARPASVREVMAALPGASDPLGAAIAAGQTPSPEMVAAAGKAGALERGRAWTMLTAFVILLVSAAMLRERTNITWYVKELKSPSVLIEQARAALRAAGYNEQRADWAARFGSLQTYVRQYLAGNPGAKTVPAVAVPLIYRESTERMSPLTWRGTIAFFDPPLVRPGMSCVVVDGEGHLFELRHTAPDRMADAGGAPDWRGLFGAAGLDLARFREVPPQWTSPMPSDRRFAWLGTDADRPGVQMRVEAASNGGRPVWFIALDPWNLPPLYGPASSGHVLAIAQFAAFVFAIIFARRNLRNGRGDVRGAFRLSLLVFITAVIAYAFTAHHHLVSPAREWALLTRLTAVALFFAVLVGVGYLAIEPYVRRRWPHLLVGWTRALAGRMRDPLVGADILTGLVIGAAGVAVSALVRLFAPLGQLPQTNPLNASAVHHFGGSVSTLLDSFVTSIVSAFAWTILLVLFRLVLRKDGAAWLALAVVVVASAASGAFPMVRVAVMAATGLAAVVALRYAGLLAATAAWWVMNFVVASPFSFSGDAAYTSRSLLMLLVVAGVGVYAFTVALGGTPMFAPALAEDEVTA